jgi:tetratricopeptide (TPR) repeat protein
MGARSRKKRERGAAAPVVPARAAGAPARVAGGSRAPAGAAAWVPALVVAAATAIAYLPTFANDFVDFDDQTNLTENPYFRGFSPRNLVWMLTHMDGLYLPLTWLSFALDYVLWGMNPVGYHLTNLLLHMANAVAFYWVAVRLLRLAFGLPADAADRPLLVAAAAAAALFALHPLRVESVAWATERRDVLSGLFFLLTIAVYLDGRARAALGWYALSLLAKAVGMGLPVVLVVLDVYPLRRLPGDPRLWLRPAHRALWREKLPFFGLGIAAAVMAGLAQSVAGALYSFADHPPSGRIAQAFWALGFYVWKTLVPLGLSPLYQIPVGWEWRRPDVLLGAVFVLGTTAALVAMRRRWPAALAAWACYLILLAPLVGLAQAGPHIAADRNTYLATLGWAALAGGLLYARARAEAAGRARAGVFRAAAGGVAAVAVALGVLTWRQVGVWHDSITLWRTAVAADPECYICQNNLGNALLRAGRHDEAQPYFEEALRIQPADDDAFANLGNVALRAGRVDEARRYYERAIAVSPEHPEAHTNLARLLIDEDRSEEAIRHLEIALRRDPLSGEAHANMGLALLDQGDLDRAERHLRESLLILPDRAASQSNFGIVLLQRGRTEEAAAAFRRAVELDPEFPEAPYNLGLALEQLGRTDEAVAALRDAIRIRPDYVRAHQKLVETLLARGDAEAAWRQVEEAERLAPESGVLVAVAFSLMSDGRLPEAVRALRRQLERAPEDGDVANMLAWVLATAPDAAVRDGAEAVRLAEAAVADAPDADRLDTLAAAYAETGQFERASATAERARAAALEDGNAEFAEEVAERAAGYAGGRPFRLEP